MMNRKSTPQLNHNELELISAFLDGQLPDEQVRQVRQRIAQEPAFKQAYEDLRLTRLALRRTPQIRRRRSFTLTPEMVGKPARVWNLQFTSRLVAVVATVLLAVVFAGDVFLLPRAGSGVALLNTANSFAANEAADIEMAPEEPMGGGAEEPMFMEQPAEEGEAAAEAAPVQEPLEASPEAPPEPAVDAGDDAAAEPSDTTAEDTGGDNGAADQGFLAESAMPTASPAPRGTPAPGAGVTEPTDKIGIQADDDAAADDTAEDMGIAGAEPVEEPQPTVERQEPGFFDRIDWLTVIEFALLALALGSGVVALVVGRRGR